MLKQRTYWGGNYWDDLSFSLLDQQWKSYQSAIKINLPVKWHSHAETLATSAG